MEHVNYEMLAKEINDGLECYMKKLLNEVEKQSIYSFGIYTSEEFNYVNPTANVSWEKFEKSKRWSPPDWRYHLFGQECFEQANTELLKGWNDDYSAFTVDREVILQIYINALIEIREKYFADTLTVVGIFMGRMGDSTVHSSIEKINPPQVFDNFQKTYHESIAHFFNQS